MKRVLLLSENASVQDIYNRSNINLLIGLDCEIHIGCNFTSGNTTSQERVDSFVVELQNAGIKCLQIKFEADGSPVGRQSEAAEAIGRILDKFDYDLIHCLSVSVLRAVGPAAKHRNIPVICTTYGLPVYEGVSLLKRIKYAGKLKFISRYASALVCCNHEDFDYAEKNLMAGKNYHIPGTGLDPYRFRVPTVGRYDMRDIMEVPQNSVVLITTGPLTKNRNHDVILKAVAKMRKLDIHYVICGRGERAGHLYSLTQKLGLEDRIHFIKNYGDIVNILHACDIFCLPSFDEGIGMDALEAMEAGLPIVATDVHGIKDFMEDSVTGYCCKAGNVSSFMRGIEMLTEDRRLREQIGQNNRTDAQKFYRDKTEKIMLDIFREYLERAEAVPDNKAEEEKAQEENPPKPEKKSERKKKVQEENSPKPEKKSERKKKVQEENSPKPEKKPLRKKKAQEENPPKPEKKPLRKKKVQEENPPKPEKKPLRKKKAKEENSPKPEKKPLRKKKVQEENPPKPEKKSERKKKVQEENSPKPEKKPLRKKKAQEENSPKPEKTKKPRKNKKETASEE